MPLRIRFWALLAAFLTFAIGGAAFASPPRLALVLGNSDYEFGRLKNPANDAALIADSLRDVGFEVFDYLQADQREMKRAIVNFGNALGAAGPDAVGLVYYAGHGVQYAGENYMIPIGAQIEDEIDVDIEGIRASTLLAALDRAGNRLNIVILDACRNNPFGASSRSAAQGLARMDAPSGTLLAYSTSPGNVAVDGTGRNSPYTQALARAIREPGTKVEDVFKRVRIAVMERTNEKQVPWEASSLTGDFYFTEALSEQPVAQAANRTPAADRQAVEIEYWKSIANSENPDLFRSYLAQFPEGVFASIANERIASLEQNQAERALTRQRDVEQQLWNEVKDSNDPALLQSFLAQYPDGIYKGLAEARLASLETKKTDTASTESQAEIVFWQSIEDSRNRADFDSYLSLYPNGRFALIAKNRIGELTPVEQQVAAIPPKPQEGEANPAPVGAIGERLWKGTVSTSGGHFAGISWCAGNKELDIELVEDDGVVNGFILAANGHRISVHGKLSNQKLDARASIARGFRVVGKRNGDTVQGQIWSPTSTMVCGAEFLIKLTAVQ